MMYIVLLLSMFLVGQAFVLQRHARLTKYAPRVVVRATPGPTYWEGAAPPSVVLGIGKNIPSAVFAPLSIVALVLGTYCIHQSNIFHQITVDTIRPAYVAGSLLVPISWGMHVAAWIQKQNNK